MSEAPQYAETNPDIFTRNTEAARTRKTGGQDYWKPNVGKAGQPAKNVIRLLPRHVNMEDVIIESKVHFSLGPNEDIAVNCLAPFGVQCPACDAVEQDFKDARSESDPATAAAYKERAKKQYGKLRFFANIIDMSKPEAGVQLFPFGPDIEKKLRNAFYDDDGHFRDVAHPQKGRDIIINASKKAGTEFNEYDIRPKETASALFDLSLLTQIGDLTERKKQPTVQDVINALNGVKPQRDAAPAAQARVAAPARTVAAPPVAPRPAGRPVTGAPPRAPAAPVVTPAPAAPTAPVLTPPVGRRPVGRPKTATAPAPPPPTRTAAVAVAAPPADPWAAARAGILAEGFNSPLPIEPGEVEEQPKPDCYAGILLAEGKEGMTLPSDTQCQGCRLILPCYTLMHGLGNGN